MSTFMMGVGALGWAIELYLQPPWRAAYILWSHFATFSYGERLLEWFQYAVASSIFGLMYLISGGILVGLAAGGFTISSKRKMGFLMPVAGACMAIGVIIVAIGGAASASGLISATVAFITGTVRAFSGG